MSEKVSKIKRRDFTKIAGAAALAGPSLNVLGANDRVRVACVGYSDRFRSSLLPCFLQHKQELNFEMVAVADLWKKRLYENAKPELEQKLGHAVATYRSDIDTHGILVETKPLYLILWHTITHLLQISQVADVIIDSLLWVRHQLDTALKLALSSE